MQIADAPKVGTGETATFKVGDTVDVEWTPGEFWRDGVITDLSEERATVRLTTGWHTYPRTCDLRHKMHNV